MEDVSIELLEKIKKFFSSQIGQSETIKNLLEKLSQKDADYEDAHKYAIEIGELLAKAFEENVDTSVLPNGKMYYNIAKKVVEPSLKESFSYVSDFSIKTQKILNEQAEIGLKVQKPEFNQAKSNGIIRRLADAESFDDIAWILKDPVVNFNQSIVDDTIEVNAKFHSKSGMHPTITRKVSGHACEWCMNLAGTYSYPDDVPNDIYRRHRDCRCIVLYKPANGKYVQDVHSKKVFSSDVEVRKRIKISNEYTKRNKNIEYKDKSVGFYENVTPEYFGLASSRKGEVIIPSEYKKSAHKEEIDFANFIHNKFGGDIKLLPEPHENGFVTPDYIWKNELWELKTVTTNKAVDSAVRKAIKQINANPGGIFVDARKVEFYNNSELFEILNRRIARSKIKKIDVMIIEPENKIKIYRYKK